MRIVGVFDKFKNSNPGNASEISNICLEKLHQLTPQRLSISTKSIPLSDGGEGFLKCLEKPLNLDIRRLRVTGTFHFDCNLVHFPSKLNSCSGPLGNLIDSEYGVNRDSKFAVIEMVFHHFLFHLPHLIKRLELQV